MPARLPPKAHGRSEVWERKALVRVIKKEQLRLGVRLRGLRTERRLSRERAAELSGLHPVSLARIEGGNANVTLATLVALATAYKVDVGAFFVPEAPASASPKRRPKPAPSTPSTSSTR